MSAPLSARVDILGEIPGPELAKQNLIAGQKGVKGHQTPEMFSHFRLRR